MAFVSTAVALLCTPLSALADAAAAKAIQDQLLIFANQKDASPDTPVTVGPTTLTAKADDLVYAVYVLAANYQNGVVGLGELTATALQAVGGKVRADKDKIAPRLLSAALLGSRRSDDPALAAQVITNLAQVNNTSTKLQLTAAGRAAVVAQALKLLSGTGSGATVGLAVRSGVLYDNSAGTGDAQVQAFAIATLKQVGTSAGAVAEFVKELEKGVTSKETFTTNVAAGVAASSPDAAGGVVEGYLSTLATDDLRKTYTAGLLVNTKVSKAVAAIVAGATATLQTTTPSAFTTALVNGLPAAKATVTMRGNIASGVLRSLGSGSLDGVIECALLGQTLSNATVTTFAGVAAAGNGDHAGAIATKMSSKFSSPTTTDLGNLGKAIVKAIAVSSPSSAADVGPALIAANPSIFGNDTNDTLKTSLAQTLALAAPTNGAATGAAVAGVASSFAFKSEGPFAALGGAAIAKAPKAATDIAKELAALDTISATSNFRSFAISLALRAKSSAAAIAAGVAITSVGGNMAAGLGGVKGEPGTGQSAGDIVVAVADADISSNSLRSKVITIAGTTAAVVDVERIADIGNKVTAVLGKGSKYPSLTSVGALATALGKAINTKPLTGTANRVDELSELAAEMTRAAIVNLGSSASSTQLSTTLGSIGTSLYKALSASLQQNGGAFPADLRDAAGEIAGAIAQTISVMGLNSSAISATNVDALLSTTGPLAKALTKAAKTFGKDVTDAFTAVVNAETTNPSTRLVTTGKLKAVSDTASGGSISGMGRYEIGRVVDPETPFQNLP